MQLPGTGICSPFARALEFSTGPLDSVERQREGKKGEWRGREKGEEGREGEERRGR